MLDKTEDLIFQSSEYLSRSEIAPTAVNPADKLDEKVKEYLGQHSVSKDVSSVYTLGAVTL